MFPAGSELRVLRILNLSRKQLFVLLSDLNWERGKVGKREGRKAMTSFFK